MLDLQEWVGVACNIAAFLNASYIVPLDMKGCICHFTKWHPFISKGTIYHAIVNFWVAAEAAGHSYVIIPSNTRRWTWVGLMLVHRLRQWTNIKPAPVQRLLCLLECHVTRMITSSSAFQAWDAVKGHCHHQRYIRKRLISWFPQYRMNYSPSRRSATAP